MRDGIMFCKYICLKYLKRPEVSENLHIKSKPSFNINADNQDKYMFFKKNSSSRILIKYTVSYQILENSKVADSHHALLLAKTLYAYGWKKQHVDHIKALMGGRMSIFVMSKKIKASGENLSEKVLLIMIHLHFLSLMVKKTGINLTIKEKCLKNIFPLKNIKY